jgi:hypothetical protein
VDRWSSLNKIPVESQVWSWFFNIWRNYVFKIYSRFLLPDAQSLAFYMTSANEFKPCQSDLSDSWKQYVLRMLNNVLDSSISSYPKLRHEIRQGINRTELRAEVEKYKSFCIADQSLKDKADSFLQMLRIN